MKDIPTHLKHKPIIKLENYSKIDGKYAGDTDTEGLSIGLAQWNGIDGKDLSAKVWRYTGEKWSRQSEELPIHRVIDLATLVCSSILYAKKGIIIGDEKFNITTSNNSELLELLKAEINSDYGDVFEPSLARLAKILKELQL